MRRRIRRELTIFAVLCVVVAAASWMFQWWMTWYVTP